MSLTSFMARVTEVPSCRAFSDMICNTAAQIEDGTIQEEAGEQLIHGLLAAYIGAKWIASDSDEPPVLVSAAEAARAYSVAYRRAYDRAWPLGRPSGVTDESIADEYPDWLPSGGGAALPKGPIVAVAQLLGTLQAEQDAALLREGQRRAQETRP